MAEIPRTHFGEAGRSRSRSMSRQQWGALIGGSVLAIYGITRRSPLGVALAAGGGTIALLGTARNSSQAESSSSTSTSLLINCTPEEAYRFWRGFENFPQFMNRLESVTVLDDRRSRWVAYGPMGRQIRWDAEITEEHENASIAWRSLPNSDVLVNGRVDFKQAPPDRGTLITVQMEFKPAPGTNGAFAKFLNKGANFALRQDMRRLEALMESGEIPTTEGQPHGPRDVVTGIMRMADPTRPIAPGSNLRNVFAAKRRIA